MLYCVYTIYYIEKQFTRNILKQDSEKYDFKTFGPLA